MDSKLNRLVNHGEETLTTTLVSRFDHHHSPWPPVSLSPAVNMSTNRLMWAVFFPCTLLVLSFFLYLSIPTSCLSVPLPSSKSSIPQCPLSRFHARTLICFFMPAVRSVSKFCLFIACMRVCVCVYICILLAYIHVSTPTCPGLGLNVSLVDWCSVWLNSTSGMNPLQSTDLKKKKKNEPTGEQNVKYQVQKALWIFSISCGACRLFIVHIQHRTKFSEGTLAVKDKR